MRRRHSILSGSQSKSRVVGYRDGQLSRGPDHIWKHSAGNRGEGLSHQVIKNISRVFHKRLRQRAKQEIDTTHAHANSKDEKSRLSVLETSQHLHASPKFFHLIHQLSPHICVGPNGNFQHKYPFRPEKGDPAASYFRSIVVEQPKTGGCTSPSVPVVLCWRALCGRLEGLNDHLAAIAVSHAV
jgi:hypothetical protein